MTNRLARYIGDGRVEIVEEPMPVCPPGGLLVQTEACGLCSGELMSWYMDQKLPHVLGHEVAGIVRESQDERFPVGSRVFPHHHAPCMACDLCRRGRYVHCPQWKRTKLRPGGMAEWFCVDAENLSDTHITDDLGAIDAALLEPFACVMKSVRLAQIEPGDRIAVIGLGVMGLMHLAAVVAHQPIGYDFNEARRTWAQSQGFRAAAPEDAQPAEVVFVCPGSQAAFDFALTMVQPGGTVVLFAPLGPGEHLAVPQSAYFKEIKLVPSYSSGPLDTALAIAAIRNGELRAEQVISEFIPLADLPLAYGEMKAGRILKPMVIF